MNRIKIFYCNLLILLFQITSPLKGNGQSIFEFYHDLNKANYFHHVEENYVKSSKEYDLVLKKFDTLFLKHNDFCFAIEAAIRSKNYNFLSKLIKSRNYFVNDSNSMDFLFIDNQYKYYDRLTKDISLLVNSEIYKEARNSGYKTRSISYYNLDPEFMKLYNMVVALCKMDQNVRNSKKSYTINSDELCFKHLEKEIDSSNIIALINILKQCKNKYQQYIILNKSSIILTHSFSYNIRNYGSMTEANYNYILNVLYYCLMAGEMPLLEYAKYLDNAVAEVRFNSIGLDKITQRYGTFLLSSFKDGKVVGNSLNPIENIFIVDSLRATIALRTLYEDSVYYGFKLPENYKMPKLPIYK